jgi:hypothetical protein
MTETKIKKLEYENRNLTDSLNRALSALKCGQGYYHENNTCYGLEQDFEYSADKPACSTFAPKEQ